MSVKRESTVPGATRRPRKTPRVAFALDDNDEAEWPATSARRHLETAALVDALSAGTICGSAWSCTNLLALPAPQPPPLPSLLGPPSTLINQAPPSIKVTHFAGTPTSPQPRLSFSLQLPPSTAPASRITRLSFSPCGAYLLAASSAATEEALTMFEQKDGCINEWEVLWHERVSRFGEEQEGEVKRFVDVRWLGEPRKFYSTPQGSSTDPSAPKRPFFSPLARSPPLNGCAFVIVLSSSELLFVNLPRSIPLLPLTVVFPLHPPPPHLTLTLSALPTAPSLPLSHAPDLSGSHVTSPQNAIDSLVANLVDGMPSNGPSPSVIVGALGLGGMEGPSGSGGGGEALQEELRAAEAGLKAKERKRKVGKAAFGAVRTGAGVDNGETLLLIATVSRPTTSPPPATDPPSQSTTLPTAAASVLPMSVDLTGDSPNANDFDMSFDALDAAFGMPAAVPDVVKKDGEENGSSDEGEPDGELESEEDDERKIELSELRIEMMVGEEPRLTIRPLAPIFLSDSLLDEENLTAGFNAPLGPLTHLDWLEDVQLPDLAANDVGSERMTDLRLLAIMAPPADDGQLRSTMSTWAMSNDPCALSEAFALLECKKADVGVSEAEWSARREAAREFDGLVTSVLPRSGPTFGSFVVCESIAPNADGAEANEAESRVLVLDILSLAPLTDLGTTKLPGSGLYSHLSISANGGLLCASPFARRTSRPVLAATPLAIGENLPFNLASQLAIALIQQRDASDLIGRVIGLDDDARTLAVVLHTRDLLQAMLPPGRPLSHTPLFLEFAGLTSTLYGASPGLTARGSVATDVLRLASLVRGFKKSEKKDRASIEAGYRCESDAVWPLIGHATWYCDFARELAIECGDIKSFVGDSVPSPQQSLLLNPTTRSLLLQSADYILGLQAFLTAFPQHQNFTVDVAKTVLDDVVDHNGLILSQWKNALVQVGGVEGVTGDGPDLQDLLVTYTVTPVFTAPSAFTSALISAPTLFVPSTALPTPPATPQDVSPALDAIRRNRLSSVGKFKQCLRCGDKAERRDRSGTETGKWSAYELGWESRCGCGGAWRALTVD